MTDSAGDGPAWDFFLSYTRADQAWAEWIAWLLEEDGYRVLVQAWDMVAGSNWISRMGQGVVYAARTVAVLSPDYLSSVYGTAEWQAAWAKDPNGQQRKLITVRVRGEWPPGLLAGLVGIDLVGLSEAAARRRLRDNVASAVRGRAKPCAPPPFPLRAVPVEPRFPGALLDVLGDNHSGRNVVDHMTADYLIPTPSPPFFLADLADEVRGQNREQLALLVGEHPLSVPWEVVPRSGHVTSSVTPAGSGSKDLFELFNAARRRLIIIGRRGSGKTVMAMLLQSHMIPLVGRGDLGVPVRFPLATWNPRTMKLKTWMTQFLRELFPAATSGFSDENLSDAIGQRWIIPLLDGFDEIAEQLQPEAQAAIDVAMSGLPMVLTSCPLNHNGAASGAPPRVSGVTVVSLRSLVSEETSVYLRQFVVDEPGEAWGRIIDELESGTQSAVADALSSPLMIWLIRMIYSSSTSNKKDVSPLLNDTTILSDQEKIERHLLNELVPSVFARGRASPEGQPIQRSSPEDAELWLMFLAAGVRAHGRIAFYSIPALAPQRRLALAFSLIAGVTIGLFVGIFAKFAIGLELSLILGACFGFGFGRGYSEGRSKRSDTSVRIGYGGRVAGTEPDLAIHLKRLGFGLFAGACCAMTAAGFGYIFWGDGLRSEIIATINGNLPRFLVLIVAGFIATTIVGYAGGTAAAIILRSSAKIDAAHTGARANTPADAVRKDRGAAMVTSALAWLTNGMLTATIFLFAFGSGIIPGFLSGMGAMVTASAVFTLWARYRPAHAWLALRSYLPWNLMQFLDEAHQHGVLRQNGNFYEFRHARLQESLTEAYRSKKSRK